MMYSQIAIFAFISLAASSPMPKAQGGGYTGVGNPLPPPIEDKRPVIDTQGDAPGDYNAGLAYTAGSEVQGGQTMTYSFLRSESSTFTVGGDAGVSIGDILSLGASVSVSETTTEGTNSGFSITCPDDGSPDEFTCGMMITPNFWQINGHVDTYIGDTIQGTESYTAMVPKTDPNGLAFVDAVPCLCPNPDNMIYPAPGSVTANCPGTCGAFNG